MSCLPARADIPKGDDKRVADAYQYLDKMQSDKAIAKLTGPFIEALREKTPAGKAKAARYLLGMAMAFRIDENTASALGCAEMATQLDPTNMLARTLEVEFLLKSGLMQRAEKRLLPLEGKAKTDSNLCRAFAMMNAVKSKFKETRSWYERGLAINDSDPRLQFQYAKMLRGKQAAEHYRKAAQNLTSPYLQSLCLWLATSYEGKGDPKYLDAAQAAAPDDPSWRTSKTWLLLYQNKPDAAYKMMIDAVGCPRMYARAYLQLLVYAAFQKKQAVAEAGIAHLRNYGVTTPEAMWAFGEVYKVAGEDAKAEGEWLRLLELTPQYTSAYGSLLSLPKYKTDLPLKKVTMEQWKTLCPFNPDAWLFDARTKNEAGQWTQALQSYERAQTNLSPREWDPQAKNGVWMALYSGMGTANYKLGNLVAAQKCAKQFNDLKAADTADLIRVRPSKVNYAKLTGKALSSAEHGMLADMLFEQNQLDDCVTEYRAAIDAADNIEWHRGLLKAYIDKHDYGAAAKEDIVVANHVVVTDLPKTIEGLQKQFQQK